MSTNENAAMPNEPSLAQTLSLRQPAALGHFGGNGFAGAPAAAPEQAKGANLQIYVHGLRRHWILALALGAVGAAVLGPIAWFVRGSLFTANAMIRVAQEQQKFLPGPSAETPTAPMQNAYDVYKETQQRLIKSRFVLNAALREKKVKDLHCVTREPDPLTWLMRELQVGSQKGTELIEVAVTLHDRDEATNIVNAVIAAYRKEIVDVERNVRVARLSELERTYSEMEGQLRQKWGEYQQLAQSAGSPDIETLTYKQQLVIQQSSQARMELMRVQFELAKARGDFEAGKELLRMMETEQVPEGEWLREIDRDPEGRNLADILTAARMRKDYIERHLRQDANPAIRRRAQQELDAAEANYRAYGKMAGDRIRQAKAAEIQREMKRLVAHVNALVEQEKACADEVKKWQLEIDKLSRQSIDVERARADHEQLKKIVTNIAEERERLKVELRSPSRIQVMGDPPATVPDSETARPVRFALTGLAALLGFCLPVLAIAWWDTRSQRINAVVEVTRNLGLPVIGSVPMIPARVIRQLSAPTRRNQSWRMRLTESVDALAARLLRKAELDQTRVVLITSAAAGEGKTTLAAQLAMSLARNLRRTVLVDWDLRRPALGGVFGLPLEPGVCEALRGEGDAAEMIQASGTDKLWVLTAGRWDRQALAALANGGAGPLLARLRSQYDFVIVDSSPVLPIADTRFVSQHVDTVVLSVFRDVSEAPKVQATCEILEAFGVRNLEAVVTGGQEHYYGKNMDYYATGTADTGPDAGPETDAETGAESNPEILE